MTFNTLGTDYRQGPSGRDDGEHAAHWLRAIAIRVMRLLFRHRPHLVLVSEDHGRIHGNNGYEFWLVAKDRKSIRTVIVFDTRLTSPKFVSRIRKSGRRHRVRRNSIRHWILYWLSDMHVVSYSYRDTHPRRLFGKNVKTRATKPIYHLRHGYEAIKVPEIRGDSYRNNLVRYSVVTHSDDLVEALTESNNFRKSQIAQERALLRWRGLLERFTPADDASDSVVWFLTWRDNLRQRDLALEDYSFDIVGHIEAVLNGLRREGRNDVELRIFLHHFWDREAVERIGEVARYFPDLDVKVDIIAGDEVADAILSATALVTDYSSIAFDFAFLGKPVYFHCPDMQEYQVTRNLHAGFVAAMGDREHTLERLVEWLVSSNRATDSFIAKAELDERVRDLVSSGAIHNTVVDRVERMLEGRLIFLGYNFFGIGGTVASTRNLAAALVDQGYLVELVSLRETGGKLSSRPQAVSTRGLHRGGRNYPSRLLRVFDVLPTKWVLPSERNHKLVATFAVFRLIGLLLTREFLTIVSTRESLHGLIHEVVGEQTRVGYWFHNPVSTILENYPDLRRELCSRSLPDVCAPSPGHFSKLATMYGLPHFRRAHTVPNTLAEDAICDRNAIWPVHFCNRKIVALVRMSPDRAAEIELFFSLAELFRRMHRSYEIRVYGQGSLLQVLRAQAKSLELESILKFPGATPHPERVIREARCVVDFGIHHSFGMIYVEALLNGKPVFARPNPGSSDILRDTGYLFESLDELVEMVEHAPFIGLDKLLRDYDRALERFGPSAVAEHFRRALLPDLSQSGLSSDRYRADVVSASQAESSRSE